MSLQWAFAPNCLAAIWFDPSDPQTDPPDSSGLDCQQLKPFYQARGIITPVMIHRLILRQTDIGNIGSTLLNAGMWIRLNSDTGLDMGWFSINDMSPFPYVDPINGTTWDFIMFSGSLANF